MALFMSMKVTKVQETKQNFIPCSRCVVYSHDERNKKVIFKTSKIYTML